MHIHTHAINYLAWRGRLDRHGVHCLAAAPFLVVNIHSTEKLERSARIRHILQPRQGRLEVLTAQLAVGAVGRREAETGYPLRVIIDDEMDKLKRQEMQEGQSGEEGGLRQSSSSMPRKVLHGQAQVSQSSSPPCGPSAATPSERPRNLTTQAIQQVLFCAACASEVLRQEIKDATVRT